MKVIFIGSFFPVEKTIEIVENSKGLIDNAANNFQMALIEGFYGYYPELELISFPAVGSYPLNYKKLFINEFIFSHNGTSIDKVVGFFNFPILKLISKYRNLQKELNKIKDNESVVVLIYAIHSPFLRAVFNLKKRNSNVKTCLIVPDLPQFMSSNTNIIYKLLKFIDYYFIKKYMAAIDSFVFFSDQMIDFIEVKNRPWTRIEGIFLPLKNLILPTKEYKKVILYTGSISERYGIKNLVEAFLLIEYNNYELWICGGGDYKNSIVKFSDYNDKIKYLGQLPFDEIQQLQKRATVLVNPRTSDGEYTKYSFPSKTMEYLASGTPTIMNRLPAVPEDYFPFIFFTENETVVGLKNKIVEVCEKDSKELIEFGIKAANFIFDNKNPKFQVKKIYDIINKI
jgi:glycosyltransferase involved in cell wall biosynthesis